MTIQNYSISLASVKSEKQREAIVKILLQRKQVIYEGSCILKNIEECRYYNYLEYTRNGYWEGSGYSNRTPITAKDFIIKFGKLKPKNNLF